MNQYAITLKNLYRILTVNDYPIFSNGVFPASRRKGLTLTVFWRSVLVPEWQYGPCGKGIWGRKQSRYCSDFCNRKDTVPTIFQLASAYLQTGEPEKAIELLIEDLNTIKDHDSVPYAEPCLLIAKAYQEVGNSEKEAEYLQLALPGFVRDYGADHAKTSYVRDRILQIQ